MAEDGKSVMFDTPENVEALQFWLDLQNKYEVMAPGIVQWTDLPTQFLAGEVAMIYHTTGNLANISKNATFEFVLHSFLETHARQLLPAAETSTSPMVSLKTVYRQLGSSSSSLLSQSAQHSGHWIQVM